MMDCPYCSSEMDHGYIEGSSNEMNWKPQKTGLFKSGNAEFNEGAVVLAPFTLKSFVAKNRVEAYYCASCRKIVIDVPLEEE